MIDVSIYAGSEAADFAEDCAALHGAAFAVVGARGWSRNEIADLLKHDTTFLVKGDGGFLIGETTTGEAEILTFAVHPDKQGQGLGRKLLENFMVECTYRKVNRSILEVAEDNAAAIALYSGYQFKTIGLRKNYFKRISGSVSALVMEKKL